MVPATSSVWPRRPKQQKVAHAAHTGDALPICTTEEEEEELGGNSWKLKLAEYITNTYKLKAKCLQKLAFSKEWGAGAWGNGRKLVGIWACKVWL